MLDCIYKIFLKIKFWKKIKIGKNTKISFFSKINITDNGLLIIGDNIIIKSQVEIRVHKNAQVLLGNKVKLDNGVRIVASNKSVVDIGNQTKIGYYTVFNAGDSIKIGNKCLISGFVYLQTSMHQHKLGSYIQEQGFNHSSIILDDDVWLGTHVVVMPGINISKGSVVGSSSVVTKNVEPNNIVAGIPANFLKTRS